MFLPGLGENRIRLVKNFPMQPVAKFRHIKIQMDKGHILCVYKRTCRPLYCYVAFHKGSFPVRVDAGIPICRIRKHPFFHKGLVMLIALPY